jgi:hypothetical protein
MAVGCMQQHRVVVGLSDFQFRNVLDLILIRNYSDHAFANVPV